MINNKENTNIEVYGSGKGGGGAPPTPTERRDNLFAEQTVRLLIAVSEGPIEAVEDIFVDEVSLDNFDSTWEYRPGTANQEVIPGFVDVEAPSPTFTSVQITKGTQKKVPDEEFEPHKFIRSVDPTADAAKAIFLINQLKFISETGDISGIKIEFDIYVRPNTSATWTLFENVVKKGKTSTGYAFDVLIPRPVGVTESSPWEIMVIRVTRDDQSVRFNRIVTWQALQQIWYKPLTYPNTALVGISLVNPKQFGGRVPELTLKVKGRKVYLPSNYNPVTRVYTGIWDGTFDTLEKKYTNNVAWAIYDVLREGLEIAQSDIDIFSIYQLAQYADQSISDGGAGTIPRYTVDYQFLYRATPQKLLSELLSLCNAVLVPNELGQISVSFLKENLPVKRNVTNQNVIDGMFTYSSTDIEQRKNLVNVTYNNGKYFGRTSTATVSEDDLISRYGLQTLDVALPGCYHEAQAIRKARTLLYINSYFTEVISFKVLLEGMVYRVGDIIRIYDNYNTPDAKSGIITNVTIDGVNTILTLDREIVLASSSRIRLYDITGTEVSVAIAQGTYSEITLLGIYDIAVNAPFVFASDAESKLYRVIEISEEDSVYSINALEYFEGLYAYVNEAITITPPTGDFNNFDQFAAPPVTNVVVSERHGSNGIVNSSGLTITWDWNTDETVNYTAYYRILWNRDYTTTHSIDNIGTKEFDIDAPLAGIYTFTIFAINPFTGLPSKPVVHEFDYRLESGLSSLHPPVNVRVTGTEGLLFNTPGLSVSFDYNTLNLLAVDALKDYVVEVWSADGVTQHDSYTVNPLIRAKVLSPYNEEESEDYYIPLDGIFEFSFEENVAQFGVPTREIQLKIYSRDNIGDLSLPVIVNVNNPVPELTAWEVVPTFSGVYVKITRSTELDVTDYIIYRSTSSDFTKDASTLIYSGPDTYHNFEADGGVTYYYAMSIADSFDRDNLNISPEISATALNVETDVYTYTGLTFIANHNGPQGDPDVNYLLNNVYWTSFEAYKNGVLLDTVSAGTAAWTTGTLYLYYIPGNTTLQSNTSLVTAIAAGGRVLATYRGGVDLQHDEGKAFISGDQVLTGTVGANALVTNTAIITNGAQIGNILESSNYNPVTKKGWRIDKDGWIQAEGITIYDSNGKIVLSSGNTDVNPTRNVFKGDWATTTEYSFGDIVIGPDGTGWIAKVDHKADVTSYIIDNWSVFEPGDSNVTFNNIDNVTLTGSDQASAGNQETFDTKIETVAVTSSTVTFNWSYQSFDDPLEGPQYDPFGYIKNGVFTQLTNDAGALTQSGTGSFSIVPGDTFGFVQRTLDNQFGAGVTTVSNLAFTNDNPILPVLPTTSNIWWEQYLAKGSSGQGIVKSFAFIRATSTPSTPTGGTFTSPNPDTIGWSDGIPVGTDPIYVSKRTFTSDGNLPQEASWSVPVLFAQDGESAEGGVVRYKFSSNATAPAVGANDAIGIGWSETPAESTIWMTQQVNTVDPAGTVTVYGSWQTPVKIKGEQGVAGTNAKTVSLSATSQIFQVLKSGSVNPSSIIFTAYGQNLSGSPSFTITGGTLTGSGTSRTLTYANMSSETARITVSWDGVLDEITVAKVREGLDGTDGASALTVIVSNEAHTVPADSSGNVTSYTGSGTIVQVYDGTTALTANATLANGRFNIGTPVASSITVGGRSYSGTTATVAQHSNMTADVVTITYPINIRRLDGTNVTLEKIQTISKGKSGVAGDNAKTVSLSTTNQVFTYNSAGSSPAPANTTVTATAINTVGTVYYRFLRNGSQVQHTTSNTYTYTPQASHANMPQTITVEIREGSTGNPVLDTDILSMIGIKPGVDGVNGSNTAVVTLYFQNTSPTVAPSNALSGTFTYNFSTGVLSGGTLNGWSTTLPTAVNGQYIWARQATAVGTGATDTIAAAEFSGAVCLSGTGANGTDGLNTATVYLYRKNTSGVSAPSSFSGTFTYTFSTGVLSGGTLNSWSQTAPTLNKGEFLWVRQATASSTTNTDNIPIGEWSTAAVVGIGGEDGTDGADGADGFTVLLTNESHIYPANSSGSIIGGMTPGYTQIRVYNGLTQLTCNNTSTAAPTVNNQYRVTAISLSGMTYTSGLVSNQYEFRPVTMTADAVNVTLTITARINGVNTAFTRVISYTKGKAGADGSPATHSVATTGSSTQPTFPANPNNGDTVFDNRAEHQRLWQYTTGVGWKATQGVINTDTRTTYIAEGAIGSVQIGTGEILTANIGNANITNLKLANNHICVSNRSLAHTPGTAGASSYLLLNSVSWTSVHGAVKPRSILVHYVIEANNVNLGSIQVTFAVATNIVMTLLPYDSTIAIGTRSISGTVGFSIQQVMMDGWVSNGWNPSAMRIQVSCKAISGSTVPINRSQVEVLEIVT